MGRVAKAFGHGPWLRSPKGATALNPPILPKSCAQKRAMRKMKFARKTIFAEQNLWIFHDVEGNAHLMPTESCRGWLNAAVGTSVNCSPGPSHKSRGTPWLEE